VFTFDFAITSFGKSKSMASNPSWFKSWSFISWSPTHSPFSLGIHLWISLILTSFVWLHKAGMRKYSMRFVLFWICSQIGWYYKWTSIMPSICIMDNQFLRVTIFYWYFGSIFPICFMILGVPITTIFFISFSTWGFHNHFIWIWHMTTWSFGWNLVHPTTTTHLLLFFLHSPMICISLIMFKMWYMFFFFSFIGGVCTLRTFHLIDKMCSLVSIRIILVHITFTKLSYT
jgi:hypothetical protein